MTLLTRNLNLKTKIFSFIAGSKSCQVFEGFDQLSSTIGKGVMLSLRQLLESD